MRLLRVPIIATISRGRSLRMSCWSIGHHLRHIIVLGGVVRRNGWRRTSIHAHRHHVRRHSSIHRSRPGTINRWTIWVCILGRRHGHHYMSGVAVGKRGRKHRHGHCLWRIIARNRGSSWHAEGGSPLLGSRVQLDCRGRLDRLTSCSGRRRFGGDSIKGLLVLGWNRGKRRNFGSGCGLRGFRGGWRR